MEFDTEDQVLSLFTSQSPPDPYVSLIVKFDTDNLGINKYEAPDRLSIPPLSTLQYNGHLGHLVMSADIS